MKPPANQPATVAASFDGRLTKYGSMRPARAPASQPRTMAARSRTRPTASRTASDPRRARIALLDFIAEVLPDLLVEPRELLAEANLDHVARPRQRDRIAGLDPTRARGEHDHLVGERDRFLEIVGDEEHRVARVRPEVEQLVLHEVARLHVERAERLVHQQHAR